MQKKSQFHQSVFPHVFSRVTNKFSGETLYLTAAADVGPEGHGEHWQVCAALGPGEAPE